MRRMPDKTLQIRALSVVPQMGRRPVDDAKFLWGGGRSPAPPAVVVACLTLWMGWGLGGWVATGTAAPQAVGSVTGVSSVVEVSSGVGHDRSVLRQDLAVDESAVDQPAVVAELKRGLEKIDEAAVREIISYLASDELEGRETLSVGFDKAAAFVASRFQQAGLQPAAGDDFYHTTLIDATQTPTDGIVVQDLDGRELEHFGLLGGGLKELHWQGALPQVDLNDPETYQDRAGPVVADWEREAGGRRVVNQIIRATNLCRQAGVTALVLRVSRDSPLLGIAAHGQRNKTVPSPRETFTIPVLLMPDDLDWDAISGVQLQLPAQRNFQAAARNVVAVLPGSDPEWADEYVLFTAHLDHLGVAMVGENRVYNGADDNASGVTAVLLLAEALAALPQRPKRSAAFIAYWGEERGLLGSRQFVRTPSIPLEKIVANVNIEMIGRPEEGAQGKIWVTGWEKSDLGELMRQAAAEYGVTIFEHPQFSAMLYGASDNFALAEAGVIAHSFSAGSLHEDYHQVTDEWERLNLPHMARVIEGLLVGSWPILQGQATPQASPDR